MENKKILKNAKILGLGLYFPKTKLLAIGDLHFGFEEYMNIQGVFIPRFNYKQIKKELTEIFQKEKIEKIVLVGDTKHGFRGLQEQEWTEISKFIRWLKQEIKEIIIIKGNHDKQIEQLEKWENIKIKKSYYEEKEKVLFVHGDVKEKFENLKECETIIIGHEHPAISLRAGVKRETYKIFLKGQIEIYKNKKTIIILPSYNRTSIGMDITRAKFNNKIIGKQIDDFEAWAIEDKEYYLGKIKKIIEMN